VTWGANVYTLTLLGNGKVLMAAGSENVDYYGGHAQLYDYATGTWSVTGSLNVKRYYHTATLLPNGKVLVAGGEGIGGVAISSAELYDPSNGTWTVTGSMTTNREGHTATLLPNGKVLVTGGALNETYDSPAFSSAEIYDPATGTWSLTTNSMVTTHSWHTATLLPTTGKVLIVGGYDETGQSAELYDPVLGTFTATTSSSAAHVGHMAVTLPNGTAFMIDQDAATEIYDPATATWSGAIYRSGGDRQSPAAVVLPTGITLFAGGVGVVSGSATDMTTAEIYDPFSCP
jgi:N-acetylneuraminic acid mutarotase